MVLIFLCPSDPLLCPMCTENGQMYLDQLCIDTLTASWWMYSLYCCLASIVIYLNVNKYWLLSWCRYSGTFTINWFRYSATFTICFITRSGLRDQCGNPPPPFGDCAVFARNTHLLHQDGYSVIIWDNPWSAAMKPSRGKEWLLLLWEQAANHCDCGI